jgi:hypothetical protein
MTWTTTQAGGSRVLARLPVKDDAFVYGLHELPVIW